MKSHIEISGLRLALAQLTARRGSRLVVVASIIAASIVLIATSLPASTPNWNSYLHDAKHPSFNAGTATFTPTASKSIVPNWTFPPQPEAFVASPTVSNGVVYIGTMTGVFYAVDESSGTELWHRDLGVTQAPSCKSAPIKGISSTATVASDSSRGGQLTVYVGGGDGFLYALRARDGTDVWSKQFVVDVNTGGYNWASPTVTGGHVYMGISSNCDQPLVRGGIKDFDQASGALLHTYWSVPQGSIGGSVWTSPASDGTSVWATIGNPKKSQTNVQDCFAIVRLDVAKLNRQDRWIVPGTAGTDLDWGSSPTLFDATLNGTLTHMVGAASKNGNFYAFKANDLASGPVWSRKLGALGLELKTKGLLLAAAIWDFKDHRLFVGSNTTTIAGATVPGSVRELNPATGKVIWARPLSGGPVMGSPAMSAGGVIAAGTYNTQTPAANRVYLLDASNGSVVNDTIQPNAPVFAQPVFADTHLFIATTAGVLSAYSVAP